jgi:hypothetical protein
MQERDESNPEFQIIYGLLPAIVRQRFPILSKGGALKIAAIRFASVKGRFENVHGLIDAYTETRACLERENPDCDKDEVSRQAVSYLVFGPEPTDK